MRRALTIFTAVVCVAGLAACAEQRLKAGEWAATPSEGLLPPTLNPITRMNRQLRDLAPPDRKVAVAVYGYADQTGQFKPAENVQQLSRAVTQGATSVLIKALQDAGGGTWFTVVERERLDNLLKERRIITDMRERYLGEKQLNPQALPPLLFAGVLLDGGIIGYDSNTRTGGAGARLLGIGGDVQYREDTVTVYLRAFSTKTGEVMVSVVAHKTILSIAAKGSVFKFVTIDRVLEAEAGFTNNEPRQIAVQQSIEKAVHAMIIEGSARGIWNFSDKAYQTSMIEKYDGDMQLAHLAKATAVAAAAAAENAAKNQVAKQETGAAPSVASANVTPTPQSAPGTAKPASPVATARAPAAGPPPVPAAPVKAAVAQAQGNAPGPRQAAPQQPAAQAPIRPASGPSQAAAGQSQTWTQTSAQMPAPAPPAPPASVTVVKTSPAQAGGTTSTTASTQPLMGPVAKPSDNSRPALVSMALQRPVAPTPATPRPAQIRSQQDQAQLPPLVLGKPVLDEPRVVLKESADAAR